MPLIFGHLDLLSSSPSNLGALLYYKIYGQLIRVTR